MISMEQSGQGWLVQSAPAKVNLMLSVHGCREDGFHELSSLVAALDFGDELELRPNGSHCDTLSSGDADIPLDSSNLVLRASELFRQTTGRKEFFDFRLKKNIPVGAGLGGGSSDAVAALRGLNELLGVGMDDDGLRVLAAQLGSDCPFFVDSRPALMRGRGELIERAEEDLAERLRGQRLVVFRPPFGVSTAWAYSQLRARPEFYEDRASAEARLDRFRAGGRWADLLHNVFEAAVGRKYLALPCLLQKLRAYGYDCMMSGSGSACYALVESSDRAASLKRICLDCWGESIFWVETSLTSGRMPQRTD